MNRIALTITEVLVLLLLAGIIAAPMKRVPLTVLIVLLALLVAACSTSQITTNVRLAIDAIDIAIPLVGSTAGLDPKILEAATNYLTQASQALDEVTKVLESGEPAVSQSAKITALLLKFTTVDLPAGTPRSVVMALSGVADAIAKILAPSGKLKLAKPGTATLKLTSADHKKLAEARVKLTSQADQLARLK